MSRVLRPPRGQHLHRAQGCILEGMNAGESDRPRPSGLGFAVWSDDEARVRRLLAEGASPDDYGDGVAGSVATLCRFGANRRAVDDQGRTPAELADEDGDDEERALILSAMS